MLHTELATDAGERGSEMVDLLKKNPAVAAEVVLGRLTQKIQEWQADKRKMTEVWQKMYDANYHKSLDHRSFYFKQVGFGLQMSTSKCVFMLLIPFRLLSFYWADLKGKMMPWRGQTAEHLMPLRECHADESTYETEL